MRAEQITGRLGYHLEGPVWWPRAAQLRLVDMLEGDVLTLQPDASADRTHLGSSIAACLRPRRDGGAIVARRHDVVVTETDDLTDPRVIATISTIDDVRGNEGGCDPSGGFYIGTMALDARPGGGSLSRIEPDGRGAQDARVTIEIPAASVSNGIAWSPGGERAYYCDSGDATISAFDWSAEDGLQHRRRFVSLGDAADDVGEVRGVPDGCCVDAEGGLWVAINGAGQVRRFTPDGSLDAVVDVDARQVTACTFGGPDLRTLFVTTSREHLADDDDPRAGSLFALDPGVTGLEPLPYAG